MITTLLHSPAGIMGLALLVVGWALTFVTGLELRSNYRPIYVLQVILSAALQVLGVGLVVGAVWS